MWQLLFCSPEMLSKGENQYGILTRFSELIEVTKILPIRKIVEGHLAEKV